MPSARKTVSIETLKLALRYDPETGNLHWQRNAGRWGRIKAGSVAGSVTRLGYLLTKFDGVRFFNHRIAWALAHGEWPSDDVDHINGVKNDNRLCNLRCVSAAQNGQNRLGPNRNTTTGFLGVTKAGDLFRAQICAHRVRKVIGDFKTPEAAHEAYVRVKRQVHSGGLL